MKTTDKTLPKGQKEIKDKRPYQKKGKKPFVRDVKDGIEVQPKVGRNDPAWYFKYPKLAELASRIAFNKRNGSYLYVQNNFTYNNPATMPDALATYYYILTPGRSEDASSGVNMTSYAAWKMLNRRFRGVSKYQQSDFGIIQFGIVDFFAHLAEAERVYGLLNYYNLQNQQVPTSLLISLGIDPFSFKDLADYRFRLNKLILAAKTLCLVKGYALLDHALLLASNVFKDKNTARAQLFGFVREGYWLYDPTNANGSSLVFTRYSTNTLLANGPHSGGGYSSLLHLRTQETILADLQLQLNALLTDDDVDNVCSDILAFYGNKEDPAEIVKLVAIPEDYVVQAIYSDSINRQYHNCSILNKFPQNTTPGYLGTTPAHGMSTKQPSSFGSTNLLVYQENNMIKFNLYSSMLQASSQTEVTHTVNGYSWAASAQSNSGYKYLDAVLDTDIEMPTPEDVMEMSRMAFTSDVGTYTESGTTYGFSEVTAFGSVVITAWTISRMPSRNWVYEENITPAPTGFDNQLSVGGIIVLHNRNIGAYFTNDAFILAWTHFDWAPILLVAYNGGSFFDIAGDIDNIISVNEHILRDMHDVAILSEFRNPIVDLLLKEE